MEHPLGSTRPAAVTADLEGLLFTAGASNNTQFIINVVDTAVQTATDHTTSIIGVGSSLSFFHFA